MDWFKEFLWIETKWIYYRYIELKNFLYQDILCPYNLIQYLYRKRYKYGSYINQINISKIHMEGIYGGL